MTTWLATHLAVANKLYYQKKITFRRPELWLLTGVYLIKDASTWTVTGDSRGSATTASVPLPEPTGIASLLGLNPNVTYETRKSHIRREGTQIMGHRVWAAQFQRIGAKYVTVADGEEFPTSSIKLLSILSSQRVRGEGTAVTLMLEDEVANIDEKGESENQGEAAPDYWKDFASELVELEEDLADDD